MIRNKIPVPELLAGLAEECTELAQAALKLRRVYDQTNPTPLPEEQALKNLHEEIADVFLYLQQIGYNEDYVNGIMKAKHERWIERLKENGRIEEP